MNAPAATETTEHLFWIIQTVTPEGDAYDLPFTGTYQEARTECHRYHPGATINRCH